MKVVSLENIKKYNELLNKKIVKSVNSVNSVKPDSNGNVDITIPEVDLSGLVKSVNNIQPDENGNVSLNVITTPGNIIKWESDYFDIGPSKTLSFDLTGTVFENEERSNINFKLVAKVKNGNDVLQAGDILFTDYNNYVGSLSAVEIGSYSYIRDKKLYIHFGNDERFVITSRDGKTDTHVSKSDVQCKIILTKVISGSNGEIGATPKSITNIVGVTDNRNLGEIFYSALPLESSRVHLLDGSVLTDATELYDYLESIKDTNPDLFTSDEEFNTEVESAGKCNKFVLNSDKSVRIPKGDSNNYIVIRSFDKKFEFNQPFSLLEPKWSDVPLNNLSWLLSNGQENTSEMYPSVYELLLNEYSSGELKTETISGSTIQYKQLGNGHKIVTDKTAYESILKNTGTAWYYLLDLEAKTFVLPRTNGFDASRSNSIYGKSETVQPNSVTGYLYFYVGDCIGTSNIVELGNLKDSVDIEVGNLKNSVLSLKSDISSYAFPGPKYEELTIPSSKTGLIAPENGWFMYQSFGSGSTNDYIFMQNNSNLLQSVMTRDLSGRGIYVSLPVKKGDTVMFEWVDSATTRKLRFIYAADKV